jgi:hypothetical protein
MNRKHQITIVVDGGAVQSVYASLPASMGVAVEILDFDNARADTDNPNALGDMRKLAAETAETQRQIY